MDATSTKRVTVLISGTGSNLRALLAHTAAGVDYEITSVISDRATAKGLGFAQERNIPTAVVSPKAHTNRTQWNQALLAEIEQTRPDWIVTAGFMRILGPDVIRKFPLRIVNVHPSLLPSFPGVHAPRQALEAGVRVTGCTVHLVDEGVDTGPILAQASVPILAQDNERDLHTRIQAVEHQLLPETLQQLATRHFAPFPWIPSPTTTSTL